MTRPRPGLIAIPIGLALLAPAPLHADVGGHVDADLDFVAPLVPLPGPAIGAGARFGWRFEIGPIWLQPEIGGTYLAFPYECRDCSEHAARVFGGLRLGGAGLVAHVIEPSIFGHAGYGWVTAGRSGWGPAFDVGFALDVRAVRHFRFGVHAAFNVVTPPVDVVTAATSGSFRWLSYGVHTGASF